MRTLRESIPLCGNSAYAASLFLYCDKGEIEIFTAIPLSISAVGMLRTMAAGSFETLFQSALKLLSSLFCLLYSQ